MNFTGFPFLLYIGLVRCLSPYYMFCCRWISVALCQEIYIFFCKLWMGGGIYIRPYQIHGAVELETSPVYMFGLPDRELCHYRTVFCPQPAWNILRLGLWGTSWIMLGRLFYGQCDFLSHAQSFYNMTMMLICHYLLIRIWSITGCHGWITCVTNTGFHLDTKR